MVNLTLIWLVLLPFILAVASYFVYRKIETDTVYRVQVLLAAIGVNLVLMVSGFYISIGQQTSDTEILNGEVMAKERIHDTYTRSYDCNCRTESSGSGSNTTSRQVCDTCYEEHYTVEWRCDTTLGGIRIDKLDETSSSVYDEPDPNRYTVIKEGDPVAKEHSYTNYIKAVPQTLFKPSSSKLKDEFLNQIPGYPDSVYDFYKIDRVLSVGVPIQNVPEWNEKLSILLKKLGPLKQANVVLVLVKTENPDYFYALQDSWINGKKNDIVVVLGGVTDLAKPPKWARVMAYAEHDLFRVKMRDALLEMPDTQVDSVLKVVEQNTMKYFERKQMADFAYLENEIDPPLWVIVTLVVLCFCSFIGGAILLWRKPSTPKWRKHY